MAAARPPRDRYDAVIVLGSRVEPDGQASAPLARRVHRGVALVRAGAAPRLLLSGGYCHGAPPVGPSEAAVMARLARDAGLPEEALLLEAESSNTWENARFSTRLMAAQGLGSALVVTDRMHLIRALLCFRRCGLRVAGRPAETGWREDPPGRLAAQACYEALALLRYLPRLLRRPPAP